MLQQIEGMLGEINLRGGEQSHQVTGEIKA
jgi:hypothetical protein